MGVEGLTSRSPEGGHKSCSREKAVGERGGQKRSARLREERMVEGGNARCSCANKIHRERREGKSLLGEKATPSSHHSRINTGIERT